ncbi:MAG TPA: hypothetical protein VN765_09025 [Candidatus Acidoferrum sp.]|nr:hypothetical protein [Candidatus Acidoferrum sp.]
MTAPALLSCHVKNSLGARPARSIPSSTADSSRPGDFQKLIGQAQAEQSAPHAASQLAPVLSPPPAPSHPSDRSDPSDPSASSSSPPSAPAPSIAALFLSILLPPPDTTVVVGRAVLCPPPESSATLTPPPTPDGVQTTARPASPNPQLAAPKPGEGGSAIPDPSTSPPPPSPVESAIRNLQSAIADPQSAFPNPPSELSPPPSGTPVALNAQRMKSASQKNDFAGSAAQKLPPEHPSAPALADADAAIPAAKSRTPASFSEPKDSAPQWLVLDTSANGSAAPTLTTNVQAGSVPSSAALSQVERLISREVLFLRDSGAQTLAVSLKVDSQTSLFLQLTNQHGQIQVAVRCEKGDAAALDAHWGQLQDSLARQNVQLLPLEDKSVSSSPSSHLPAPAPGNSQHGPPAQHPPPRPPASKSEKPSDDAMNAAIGLAKSKTKARHYRGWEKWA